MSSHDGKIIAGNLLDGNRHKPDYRGVPSVAFTIPPIAAVGLGEAEARAKGLKFRINSEKVSNWYTARRLNETVYGFKTLVDPDAGRILGAHLVGPHVDEDQPLWLGDPPRTHRRRSEIDDVRISDGGFGYWRHGLAFDAEEHDDSTIHYHLSELRHG